LWGEEEVSVDERVVRFREEKGRRESEGKRRIRYPEDVRGLAVSYAEAKRAEGVSVYQAACDLGLGVQTLTSWLEGRPARPSRAFRPVEVVAAKASTSGLLTLRTAQGHTIAGLDVATLLRLVRELDGR
jgi:hypothetical protein